MVHPLSVRYSALLLTTVFVFYCCLGGCAPSESFSAATSETAAAQKSAVHDLPPDAPPKGSPGGRTTSSTRGITSKPNPSNRRIGGPAGGYALIIGVGNYRSWPRLYTISEEINTVERALRSRGFAIIRVDNPNSIELRNAFQSFINRYGLTYENRLLFFFSGHGYTFAGTGDSYVVPRDAPLPTRNPQDFRTMSLNLKQVMDWSSQIKAKHALFIFDSCFSGSLFKTRGSAPSANIPRLLRLPVRQYITSGAAGQTVPSRSIFSPAFARAIESGTGDLNRDGYITGTELGLYLRDSVPGYVNQDPQFGRHWDYAEGDFVFRLSRTSPRGGDEGLDRLAADRTTRSSEQSPDQEDQALSVDEATERVSGLASTMVDLRGGCFLAGSPSTEIGRDRDEKQRTVCVKPFAISRTEITQSFWKQIMGNNPSHFQGCPDCPVENVSWNDAQTFIKKVNRRTGMNYRLPTEMEWEYAARAGTISAFNWSGAFDSSKANARADISYAGSTRGFWRQSTVPVASFPANAWGLYDMHGNVEEWTCSRYGSTVIGIGFITGGSSPGCAVRVGKNTNLVLKGGSWSDEPIRIRSAFRGWNHRDYKSHSVGLRLAR